MLCCCLTDGCRSLTLCWRPQLNRGAVLLLLCRVRWAFLQVRKVTTPEVSMHAPVGPISNPWVPSPRRAPWGRQGAATWVLPSSSMSQCDWEGWEVGGQVREAAQDRMGWGGREHLSLQHEGCAPPISLPTDKGPMLWGRGTVSAAKQEERKEGVWKE